MINEYNHDQFIKDSTTIHRNCHILKRDMIRYLARNRCIKQFAVMAMLMLTPSTFAGTINPWRQLSNGLELASFRVNSDSAAVDSTITVLRINPAKYELKLLSRSGTGEPNNLTAKEWCEKYNLIAAINAGMFASDFVTHVGYMKSDTHVNSKHINSYQSVAAFNPIRVGEPAFRIFDLDADSMSSIIQNYKCLVQNLRLIKRPGNNQWAQQDKRWNEAALGEDSLGRIMFIYCRTAYSMHDLNKLLLSLPLQLVAAQHLEGGPEAQLYLHCDNNESELIGSYETGFNPNDDNSLAWPIPNILGIVPKSH